LRASVGAYRRHRGLAAVQHDGRISLRHNGIDAGEELVAVDHRTVGGNDVHSAVGAAQHQLAVGAACDGGEIGVGRVGDIHPGRVPSGQVDHDEAAAGGEVGGAAAVA